MKATVGQRIMLGIDGEGRMPLDGRPVEIVAKLNQRLIWPEDPLSSGNGSATCHGYIRSTADRG